MKERLLNEGWVDVGGCSCSGGAKFYHHKDFNHVRVVDYFRRKFVVIKFRGKKEETYHYRRSEAFWNDIEKYRN